LYKLGGFPSLRGPSFDLVEIYSYSASVVLIAASNQLIVWTDILFLSVFVSAGAVGHYQAAYQTSALLTFALVSANTVFPPLASEFCNQGETEMLRELYEVVTKWIVLVTTYAMAFVIVFASDLLSLFGMGFATAQSVLVLLAVSQGVVAAVGPVGYLLSMSEYERVEMINTIVAGLVNVVLNFLLIQRYGILGAAVATGISLALVNGLGLIEIRSIFGFNPFSRLSPQAIAPVGGAIVLMVAISYIDAQPLLRLLIGGTCSLVIFGLLASKYAFGPEDSLLFNAL
jgi:O-antigen/teichoic acid export membrane protein